MPEHGERVVRLEVHGQSVTYFSAGLFRGQARPPGGLRGHTSWRPEIFDPDLSPAYATSSRSASTAGRAGRPAPPS
ncbi:MAG: hypothetical protein ACHQ01_08640 [Candidatus Limnocylindrales bacterium]